MKSVLVHLMSAFFGGQIKSSGNDIDVHGGEGQHMVAVRDGRCQSEALGCSHRFSLDPIPRDARLYKEVGGKIVKDERFDERLQLRKKYLDENGVVKPITKLKEEGYTFHDNGDLKSSPVVQEKVEPALS